MFGLALIYIVIGMEILVNKLLLQLNVVILVEPVLLIAKEKEAHVLGLLEQNVLQIAQLLQVPLLLTLAKHMIQNVH